MAWVAQGGQAIGKERGKNGVGGGGGDGSDDEDAAGGKGTLQGVPLCREALCSGRGMPPRPLPQPGIGCVNRDNPCLPCDIVNLRLRSSVTGAQVKQAVAEAQKRYFCAVWNLLFGHLFPDHMARECPQLKAGDPEPPCRNAQKARALLKSPPSPGLPYGVDPLKAMGTVFTRKAPVKRRPPDTPKRRSSSSSKFTTAFFVKKDKYLRPNRPPEKRRPEMAPEKATPRASVSKIPKSQLPRKMPASLERKRPGGGNLKYNIWAMPMPDFSKISQKSDKGGKKSDKGGDKDDKKSGYFF